MSVQCRVSLFMRSAQEDSIGFFDHMRSGCEHSSSFKSVNMQNKHGSSILLHGYLKRCIEHSLIRYSFYVMESRVSSNCTHNIHRSVARSRGTNA